MDAAEDAARVKRGRVRPLAMGAAVCGALLLAAAHLLVREPDLPSSWTEPVTGMEFLVVRPGSFRMGTPPDEA